MRILDDCKIREKEYEKGISKIFIRNPRIIFQLEELRSKKLVELVAKIQVNSLIKEPNFPTQNAHFN